MAFNVYTPSDHATACVFNPRVIFPG